ncbi:MAG: hypothetical protein CMJ83_12930 [Planctomycetes bacterium]|nr:hypothetical protein [Planctomycetota bacterium]
MSFTNLSPLLLGGGLAVLAGALFLLQRLRVRYQPRRVVTTLFWKEAVEEARARILVRRFRHLFAYLLVLLIAGLLWLGVGDPQWSQADESDHIILIDGSAGMAWGQRFEDVIANVKARAASLPRDRRRVLLCQSRVRPLLLPGEHEKVLERRLEGVLPESCPATVEGTLRELVRTRSDGRALSVIIAGDAPIDNDMFDMLGGNVSVRRLSNEPLDRAGNRGITALGVTPAESGAWDRVDVLVETRGGDAGVSLTLNGSPLDTTGARSTQVAGHRRLFVPDVPARGGALKASLAGNDPLPVDDVARIVLPDRPRIRVALSASLRATLGPVLEADSGVVITDGEADVAIRTAGEPSGGNVPALEWVTPDSIPQTILLTHERDLLSRNVLLQSFDRLGLEDVDTAELARQTGRVISLGAAPGDRRGIAVWNTLLGEDYNFVQARSFPLFVASSVRWLAGTEEFPAFVAAHEVVRAASGPAGEPWRDESGAPLRPPRAGTYTDASGRPLAASLLDPWTTSGGVVSEVSGDVADPMAEGGIDPLTLLGLLALLLLMIEWVIYRTGRMP